jgi:glycosyltransferase involved in cell wall biosynthesis
MHSDSGDGRVHIVLRTKERPALLARALDDILGQRHTNWTLTVVNDGGTPSPVDRLLAERAGALASRESVIHNPASNGMEAAANQGVRAGDAPFVAIHDDDDTWHPDFLERSVQWLAAHAESPAVASRTEIVWERAHMDGFEELSREVFLPDLEQVTLSDLLRFNTCVPISMLYRAAALHGVGLFDESLQVTGDWECNLRLAVTGPIGFLGDQPLAYWHQRPGAAGELGNSVIALSDDHRRADRLVRDRALRASASDGELGVPLYLTRFLDDRFDELNRRIDHLEAVAGDTLFRRAKSALRRVITREPRA